MRILHCVGEKTVRKLVLRDDGVAIVILLDDSLGNFSAFILKYLSNDGEVAQRITLIKMEHLLSRLSIYLSS